VQLNLLHLDDALSAQTDFLRAASQARHVHAEQDGERVRLWGKQPALDALAAKLPPLFDGDGPFLTFMGSGDFHHVTALLLAEVARKNPAPITLIHFDNHPDWVKYNGGMHCGSWLNGARAISNVQRALTLGLCSDDIHNKSGQANTDLTTSGFLEIFPYANTIGKIGLAEFTAQFLARISTKNVYITLDKDVLAPTDAITNWDQGQMHLDDVIHIINAIGAQHKIIGADVVGDYSPVKFSSSPIQKILKYGEVFLDHPRARPKAAAAAAINAAANIRLLHAFSMLMQ
jgi:arginase family enzyme